jgi:hypothetical protein
LIQQHTEGTDTGVTMLFFVCAGLTYYGGNAGSGVSHHQTRKATWPTRE